ncbi:hypothetical protein BDV59DRAFT_102534 [Aspergillus ambiguus]|uniref:uncharacterized protein n=1 Tax=Aspergillus ambiguus TaxID=176160 RepID=UPI003CCDF780
MLSLLHRIVQALYTHPCQGRRSQFPSTVPWTNGDASHGSSRGFSAPRTFRPLSLRMKRSTPGLLCHPHLGSPAESTKTPTPQKKKSNFQTNELHYHSGQQSVIHEDLHP